MQLAKWKGAQVIGTASAENRAFLLELDIDEVIDYTSDHFENKAKDVDMVLDTLGGDIFFNKIFCSD